MIYLGTLGRMVGLKCPSSQQVQAEDRISFGSTLGGRRVGQIAPGNPKRAWQNQLSDASTPGQVGAVMSFINGEWGNGPFVYVSADAPGSNLLTPAAASCDPKEFIPTSGAVVTSVGPMLTPDGWAGRSFAKNTVNGIFLGLDMVPLIPGQAVTVSAYVRGTGGAVRLFWYDAAGAQISFVTSTVTAGASDVVRSFITATPPSNAVSFRPAVNSQVTQVTRPAATWSDGLLGWGAGQGCTKAVPHGASSDLIMASRDPRGGRYSNLGFTVTEVG